jgi:predicted TIM-barrel fold metal-dependent hydrolase
VYYDTAASPFLYDSRIYRYAKDLVGMDKVLLGTDYPLLKPQRYRREMAEAGLDREDVNRICGLNAARLLKIDIEG